MAARIKAALGKAAERRVSGAVKFVLLLLLVVAGCDSPPSGQAQAAQGRRTACALQGAAEFADMCTAVRADRGGDQVLTLIAPNGGFRRLAVRGGRITAADGAERARVKQGPGNTLEVAVGRDRYQLAVEAE